MRLLLFALNLALLSLPLHSLTPAHAASLTNTTQHSFIPGHGQVIEYLAADGSTLLWYPGNDRPAPGEWKLKGHPAPASPPDASNLPSSPDALVTAIHHP
jgi:hypothetical protein